MRRSILTLWGPFFAALAAVFWLSSLTDVPGARYFWDKLLHMVGYAGLGVLALRAFHGGFGRLRPAPTMFAGIAIILWGASDEFHQSFVPGRDATVWDLVADSLGFVLAVLLLLAIRRYRENRAEQSR